MCTGFKSAPNPTHLPNPLKLKTRRETNCFVELYTIQSFQVSPLDDKLAPVGPLEGGAKLEEGKPNLLRKKAQSFRLPK